MNPGRLLQAARKRSGSVSTISPELISGASDNDPTNVGTAVAVGASTAYQLTWVALLVAPLLGVVQMIAAQVGSVSRNDLQSLTLQRYGRRVAATLLVSVVVVNLVTIAADLEAGAAGIGMLVGVGSSWLVLPFGCVLVVLLLVGQYQSVVAVLRLLLLGFLAFGASAVLAHPDWPTLLKSSLIPTLSLRSDVVGGALALLGTTLTSYVYVWETVGRGVEEGTADGPSYDGSLARARHGAIVGAVFAAVILWFMLVASAATLGQHHHAVTSAQDAAQALRPLAGPQAASLFAIGLVISAVVALPVLMATTAYVVGAQFKWRRGLSEPVHNAKAFYGVLAASLGLAFAVALAQVPVIAMLVAASIIGGIGTPIGMVTLVLLARDRRVMGTRCISLRLAVAGWTVAVIVGGLGLLFVLAAAL